MDYRDKAHAQQVVKQQEYNRDFNKAFWNPELENEAKDVILDSTFFDLFTPASWQSLLGLNISGGGAKEIKSPALDAGGSVTVDYRAIDDAMDGMPDATVDPGYYDENIDLQGGGQVSSGLDNLYMNNRNSKHKLDNMLGFKERQYGGGLDDAYMNRRRSSAFAAPDATSAFASPMSQGGLPTIYRANGGDFDFMDSYTQADIDAAMADPTDDGLGDVGGGDGGLPGGSPAPAAAPQGGPSGDIGSDVDAGGYGIASTAAGLLGLQRADPNQPNIGFEAYFNPNDEGSYDVGMPASPSKLGSIRNVLNSLLPNVFDKPSSPAFVVGKDAEDRRGAYSAAMKGYKERGLPRDQYDSWFSKNAGNLMEGYRKGGDAFDFHANKISTDASNKFNSALEYNKNLESNKGKTEEEVANETVQELFGSTFEKAGTEGYPIWAPGGGLVALTNAIGKATGKIGTVTLNGVRMEVNKDGTLREEDPIPTNVDYGSDAPDEKGTPKTEKDVELVNDLKKKSVMGELLRKEKKKRIDPNIQIIMDIYGLTFEEAERFLGKESGIGTGGVGEFEGI